MMGATNDAREVPVQLQPDNIPLSLRAEKRWVAWLPKWADGKFGKKPGRLDRPGVGLTNWAEEGWADFETAVAAWRANPKVFGGVGYVMTNSQSVTGVDLDHCIDAAGAIAPWAQEIIRGLGTYTEVSPSGTGIRAFITGNLDDWQTPRDGEVKIEVYGGSAGRFLTVTGARIPGAAIEVKEADSEVLADMKARYRMVPKSTDNVESLHLPGIIPECLLKDINDLMLPPHAKNFLTDGPTKTDRSGQLFATSIALSQAGESKEEIYSRLAQNEHALSLAEDHWKGHAEKALRYLWKHSAQQGVKRANDFKQEKFNEFEDIDFDQRQPQAEQAAPPPGQVLDSSSDFENLDAIAPQQVAAPDNRHLDLQPLKKRRFESESVVEFLNRSAPAWIVKKVVPRAGLAVIYGNSDAGKTFFTLDLVGAIARGVEWRGEKVKKGRVLYVVAEGTGGFRNRLKAYCEFHGVDPAGLDIRLLKQTPNLLEKEDIREFLQEILAQGKFDVIVLDTYARAMAGANENDAKDAGQAVAHCDAIHRKTGALVVLIHHSGKDASKGARGSGALRAAADLEIEVVRTKQYRAATITKQKDGADGAEYQFKLGEVVLGEDEDGEAITSCVIDHIKEPIKKIDPGIKGTSLVVFNTVSTLLDLGGELTYAAAIDASVLQIPHDENKRDRRRDLVVRALQDLEGKNLLKIDGGIVYLQ